ncbi:hypothetical protein BH20CHL6_BH20CHL6_15390 [soil metagenome]
MPASATPGDYITSLVIENADPVEGTGPVAVDQVVRQAIAVVIDVPGPRTPALAVGGGEHRVVNGNSLFLDRAAESGNADLKPRADVVIRDAAGAETKSFRIAMDSFYAKRRRPASRSRSTASSPKARTRLS